MKWIVTGSAGFIGSRLVDTLEDVDLCDIRNSNRGYDDISQVVWDPGEYEVIANLAAVSGIADCRSKPATAFSTNTAGTARLLNPANEDKARFVFASSAAAAQPENSIYAATKASAEHLCQAYRKEYGLHVSILRLGNVYGPGSVDKSSCVAAFCKQAIKDGRIIVEGNGHQTRHFVHVDDVVKAIHHMPDGLHAVHPYEQHEVGAVAEMVANLSGADIYHVPARPNDPVRSLCLVPNIKLDYKGLWDGVKETWQYFKETMQ